MKDLKTIATSVLDDMQQIAGDNGFNWFASYLTYQIDLIYAANSKEEINAIMNFTCTQADILLNTNK